jgi:hypothetical protein
MNQLPYRLFLQVFPQQNKGFFARFSGSRAAAFIPRTIRIKVRH